MYADVILAAAAKEDGVIIPVEAGCVVEIPTGESAQVLQFIGLVPTNTITITLWVFT